jgi:polygalacturonase
MTGNLIRLFWLVCLFIGTAARAAYNVRDFGAAGDGATKDTVAIQKAIDAAASAGGGEVIVTSGTYVAGSIELKSGVTLDLAAGAAICGSADIADYPLVTARWEGLEHQCHQALIFANDAANIRITGSGSILGNGEVGKLRNPRGPTLIEPTNCKAVAMSGVTLGNMSMWTLHPTYCQDVTISHITFDSHGGNSDGVDPDSCQRVAIKDCTFTSGDDDIAVKSGKGQEGVAIGKPCDTIVVMNCNFLTGHAGIALGSELSGGIRHVMIEHCKFNKVAEAIYLKSRPGRAGYVQDVRASDLQVNGPLLLVVQTTYHSNPDSQGVPGEAGLTSFSGIEISNVRANSKSLVRVEATPEKPLDGLTLDDIRGSCEQGFVIRNARNVVLKDIKLSGIQGPPIYTENAQGAGLDEAAPHSPAP